LSERRFDSHYRFAHESANRLTDELEALSRQENKSADDRERTRAIIAELSNAYGDLNHLIDEEGNLIGKSIGELRSYIRTRDDASRFTAVQERQAELQQEHIIITINWPLIAKATPFGAAA